MSSNELIRVFIKFSDESGCEADMAEGGAEEESGDMLGPAIAPVHQSPSALNVKAEVSPIDVDVALVVGALSTTLRCVVALTLLFAPL